MKVPEQFRWKNFAPGYETNTGDMFGIFVVPPIHAPLRRGLKIIAADGEETRWDHVSVSLMEQPTKTPTWAEMCFVKSLFWEPTECVVQFHVPDADHINIREVLHLWKALDAPFPTPPKICV